MSHPHGCVSWNSELKNWGRVGHFVTPSRVCELKSGYAEWYIWFWCCHTLTGVWVEIKGQTFDFFICIVTPSRVCELKFGLILSHKDIFQSHTLTGVWVEINLLLNNSAVSKSHPHGCVSWNAIISPNICWYIGHTLTGVWVEIHWNWTSSVSRQGHTLTGVWVEMKTEVRIVSRSESSHPHGCVSWNF